MDNCVDIEIHSSVNISEELEALKLKWSAEQDIIKSKIRC
jgi:hypothetical protein